MYMWSSSSLKLFILHIYKLDTRPYFLPPPLTPLDRNMNCIQPRNYPNNLHRVHDIKTFNPRVPTVEQVVNMQASEIIRTNSFIVILNFD